MKLTLQFTRDYEKFVFKADNRDTKDSRQHIKDLMESMKRHGYIKSKAISVRKVEGSSKLEIVDGQHRFLAAKELDIPVWFEIDNEITDEALPDMQIAKKWLPKDYLKHFVVKGKPDYKRLEELYQQYEAVGITSIVLLLMGGFNENGYLNRYKHGELKIVTPDEAINTLQKGAELYKLFNHRWLTGRTFLAAFINVLELPGFKFPILLDKLKYRSEDFRQMLSEEGYYEMLGKIYNHGSRVNRIDFSLLAMEKVKEARKKRIDNKAKKHS